LKAENNSLDEPYHYILSIATSSMLIGWQVLFASWVKNYIKPCAFTVVKKKRNTHFSFSEFAS
jgi:hypothetical protein